MPVDDERAAAGTTAGDAGRRTCRSCASLIRVGCHGSVPMFRRDAPFRRPLPPAASIAALAPLVAPMPVELDRLARARRDLMTLTTLRSWPHEARLASAPAGRPRPRRAARRSASVHLGVVLAARCDLKPRLGRRRCSGIWPPSKPTLWKPPERDFWPLWPRPAVLPRPEPMPRPTRRRRLLGARGRLDAY